MKNLNKLIFIISIFFGLAIFSLRIQTEKCFTDFECKWTITNCCPEEAGAKWECINVKIKIECPETILCPQFLSPKPLRNCVCKNFVCKAE